MVFLFLSSNNISTDEQILNRFRVEEEATEITMYYIRRNIIWHCSGIRTISTTNPWDSCPVKSVYQSTM